MDDTLTFGGVPIKFFQKPAAYDRDIIISVWQVGDFERPSLRKAQETIVGKHQTIKRLEQRIVEEHKTIAELKEKLTAGFEKEHELVELKIKFSTIVRKIEKMSEEAS